MRKMMLVMRSEVGTTLRRKSFTLIAFGLPLLLGIVALVIMIVNRDPAAEEVVSGPEAALDKTEGYVDEGGLIGSLPPETPAGWLREFPDETAADQALEAGEIDAFYVIPADYMESGDLVIVTPTHNPLGGQSSTAGIEWVLLYNLFGGDIELATSAWQPLDLEFSRLASAEESVAEDSWIAELLPTLMTLITYMVIIMTASVLVSAVADEKKNRVMEILMSSISANQMIAGKILAAGFLGLLQILLWVGILFMVVRFGGQPLNIPAGFELPRGLLIWAAIYALLGYAMYGSQMAGLGALVPDIKDARGASMLVLSPFILAYMFNIVVMTNPDGPIALGLSFFPLTSPVSMITRMTVTDVPLWQGVLAAVMQLLTAIIIIRLVARLFRAQTLLSGQPFAIKRYYKALLGRA